MPLPLLALLGLIGAGTAAAGSAVGAARRSGKKRNPLEDALDADVIDKGPDSAFMSILETLGRPGHMVNDLAVGNFEGAGRQLVDLGGDLVDAALPGDWIPHISRRMDKADFSDVIGGMDPGLAKTAVDVAGGVATDPLNLIPGEAVGKALNVGKTVVGKAVSKLPDGLQSGLDDFALGAKESLGWLNPSNEAKGAIAGGRALRGRAAKAGSAEAERIMGALPENLQVMVADVIDNLNHGDEAVTVLKPDLGRRAGAIEPIDQQLATLHARVEAHPQFAGLDDAAKAQLTQAIDDSIKLAHAQYLDDLKHGAMAKPVQYTDPTGKRFMKDELEEMYRQERGMADSLGRKGESLADNVHDLDVETNLANRLANQKAGQVGRRVQTQGGPTLNQALKDTSDPVAVTKYGLEDMDPFFPRLFGKLQSIDRAEIPRSQVSKLLDHGEVIWERNPKVKRKFGEEVSPTGQLNAEMKRQARRDATLSGKQGDVADELARIDPGKFDEFVRGRGLSVSDVDVSNASPRNYLQRLFEFPDDNEVKALGKGGTASALKSRKLDDEALAKYLTENPDTGYERNAFKRLLKRNDQQGRILEKATIAKQVLGQRFTNLVDGVYRTAEDGRQVYDKSVNAAFDEAIEAMSKTDPDSARALANAYHGATARGPVLDVLAKANRLFKPAAVYGVILPKMGSIVRNDLGTSWQIMSTQGVKAAGKNLARMPRRLWDSINDGTAKAFGWKHVKPGQLTKDLDLIDEAHKAARGSEQAVMDYLANAGRTDLAEAARHGVLDGFVSSEEIMKKSAGDKWWKKKFFDLYDAPGAVFQGVEQRARLGNFLERFATHKDGAKAAMEGREALLDYNVGGSSKNRTLRDLIPFAAFLAGSVKQQSKFLAGNPGAAGALSRALEQDPDQQVYPYMEGRLNVPIGHDTEGNQQFVSGFGLPFEALQSVPNPSADLGTFGRQVEQSIVGSTHPLLKSALAATFGEDPYFGTPYGSYDKLPVFGEAGDVGRTYNKLAGTGMIQPLDTPLRLIDDALDPRHAGLAKAADLLTGANVVSVDQDRALQQRLQQQLENSPEVAQHRSFYDRSGDPETQALLQAYNAAKARVKAKRQAQQSAAASDPGTL